MRVIVEHIPAAGLPILLDPGAGWVREAAALALERPVHAVGGSLFLERAGKKVIVTGEIFAEADADCDRCQADLRLRLEGPVELSYEPEGAAPVVDTEEELELSPEDLDVGWYDGEGLDLGAVLSEQIALWMPDRVLCESKETTRRGSSDAVCALPDAVTRPDPRSSPFAGIRLPK